MKSLPMVARTEVFMYENMDIKDGFMISSKEQLSVKDRTSCKENLHLGREDDILKIVQVEGAKCINT
jgi:hypothetical protein